MTPPLARFEKGAALRWYAFGSDDENPNGERHGNVYIHEFNRARARDIRGNDGPVALVVHKRSPSGLRLPPRSPPLVEGSVSGSVGWQLLQRAHPGSVRRPFPSTAAMAALIAANVAETSVFQLVVGDSGRSGLSVCVQPPRKTRSCCAALSADSTMHSVGIRRAALGMVSSDCTTLPLPLGLRARSIRDLGIITARRSNAFDGGFDPGRGAEDVWTKV